jgi:hypothetical protein
MSTSGITTWNLTRDEFINSALRKLGVLAEGITANSSQLTTGAEALNALIKAFHADGMPVWAIKEYTFTTTATTSTYNIGVSQTLNTPMPLKIVQAYRIENTGAVNTPMTIYNHYDYNLLPQNASPGEPIQLFYQPFSTYGTIKLWPTPIDSNTTITIVYQRPFEDVVSGSDNLDFPSQWNEAVIYNLAWRLAPEYGVAVLDRQNIASEAKYFKEEALSFGTEEGSLFLMPDWAGRK